jgi:hypothetical protein
MGNEKQGLNVRSVMDGKSCVVFQVQIKGVVYSSSQQDQEQEQEKKQSKESKHTWAISLSLSSPEGSSRDIIGALFSKD